MRPDPSALPQLLQAVIRGDCNDPFAVLGPHALDDGRACVRVFWPQAHALQLVDAQGERLAQAQRVADEGLWQACLPQAAGYRLLVQDDAGSRVLDDAYRFGPVLPDAAVRGFAHDPQLRSDEWLGAHPCVLDGVAGTRFCVWAPNAARVSVIGDFCAWDGRRLPMRRRHDAGLWELFVPAVGPGALYKYEILARNGELLPAKADPVAFQMQPPPQTASVVTRLPRPAPDAAWLAQRRQAQQHDAPISIYEAHLGSWRRRDDGSWLSYDELAQTLIPYVAELGFTHLELLPISEHPFSGSWGYQPVGLYAPTARFGVARDFARFVAQCHAAGIGLWLDWVPGHFPNDAHGLARFDGSHLYEHADPRQGFHPDWNTLIYNFGRAEVRSYLLDNALFWLRQYGVDGLRVDAVASMLYLDYSRAAGQWVPNRHGGRENLEAIELLKQLNERVFGLNTGATTAAEESTAWPGVSQPTWSGGLGFGYKWNMGWMHDTLAYMHEDPVHRRWHHDKLTFGLVYAFSEHFVLPLSHDEVVHGKGSLLAKMPGDDWQRFANLRAYFGFMWGHPGKKLLFMGGEFGQRREWNHDRGLDWELLQQAPHRGIRQLVCDLNRYYRKTPALHQCDKDAQSFEWLVMDDAAQSVLAFLRRGKAGTAPVVVVCNFTPVPRHDYRLGVPEAGFWRERINTDASDYGGSGVGNLGGATAEAVASHGRAWSIRLTLPPLATLFLEWERP